jgi:Uma2 family endonuclease
MIEAGHSAVVLLEEDIRIPVTVHAFEEFRRWSHGEQFPERGRIDYLQGDIVLEMRPEELFTHGTVKTAIASRLHELVAEQDRGYVFVGRTRVASPVAMLSVEPDVVAVLWESLEAGRTRKVPSTPPLPGRYVELEGAPDVVVEVVSDSSLERDRTRLPALYARAGVPELWLVDARGDAPAFEIWSLKAGKYEQAVADSPWPDGWTASPVLGCRFRLQRRMLREGPFVYSLESLS